MQFNNINIPLVIFYENDAENINSKKFENTLFNNNWQYLSVGRGRKWTGFGERILGYYYTLNSLPNDKIVVLSDARDVFCLRNSEFFIEHVKDIIKDKTIISAELFLASHINWSKEQIENAIKKNPNFFYQGVPLDNYWKYHNKHTDLPLRKYLNAGLIVGKVIHLKKIYKWLLDNNYNDDQLGLANYANIYPEEIHLDFEASIVHTSTFGTNGCLYNTKEQVKDSPTFAELLGLTSYFLHIPGLGGSKGQTYVYGLISKLLDKSFIDKNMHQIYNLKPNLENKYYFTH